MAEVLVFYYIVSLLILAILLKKAKENRLLKIATVCFLPLVGWFVLYALLRSTGELTMFNTEESNGSTEDLSAVFMKVDIEEETNVIPIQDALILNHNDIKRKMLIHSLKENTMTNMLVLQKALENEDSETSHYAASAIVEMKRKRLNHIKKVEDSLSREETSDLLSEYVQAIKQYMDSGFLDDITKHKYREKLSTALNQLLESGEALPWHCKIKVETELELKRYQEAEAASSFFLDQYPSEEQAYLTAMKVYYATNNELGIRQMLKQIRRNRIFLTTEGADIVRFWN
ncbi:hypothetical protein KP77_32440 [Jeotgalibacillus alimentarius]|uniref:Uncharacterized protein n=1 Tax=Jeotgalibacillus alimentarius TaxID=135826 RepID=A0A0C2VHS9_9BACL|nr:hypothetical protein [Jeotgalibacillus alimentarius]KIL43538.1 hypothetical protein KP77_32440 [Jeotgalibacillus alimentarius]